MLRPLLLCMVLGAAVPPPASAGSAVEVEIGGVLREATLHGLNGPDRKLSEFRGRPLLINVWASWCGPCRQEMASLERLAWRDPARSFAIIGVSTDDFRDKALAFLQGSNATISHFLDHDLQMEQMLGANRLPLTILVGADGRVLDKIYGSRQWDAADAIRQIDQTFEQHPSFQPKVRPR